ncbi:hypothetical protein KGF57_001474 [Candida theae]|uniref:Thioredoxin domain-containing protein n=1 Tax=Candida theae TaxID=1198502 RepID=A0AAD5FZX1_9ASCO|nr:uncharacterized protein KGF57_001474 [Candida theae]KAI5962740.1 hypothetical protein KGF57_001474 [Candida theae]
MVSQFPTNVKAKYVPYDNEHSEISKAGAPKPLDLAEEFKAGPVIITAIPGAFTPTCSLKHIPDYIKNVEEFKKKGVKRVIVLAVNDPFVLSAFGKAVGYKDEENFVIFATDPEGKISSQLGDDYVLDLSSAGLGKRLQRYAAIVKDGDVFYLANEDGGDFTDISSAETLLKKL